MKVSLPPSVTPTSCEATKGPPAALLPVPAAGLAEVLLGAPVEASWFAGQPPEANQSPEQRTRWVTSEQSWLLCGARRVPPSSSVPMERPEDTCLCRGKTRIGRSCLSQSCSQTKAQLPQKSRLTGSCGLPSSAVPERNSDLHLLMTG